MNLDLPEQPKMIANKMQMSEVTSGLKVFDETIFLDKYGLISS